MVRNKAEGAHAVPAKGAIVRKKSTYVKTGYQKEVRIAKAAAELQRSFPRFGEYVLEDEYDDRPY